MQKAERGLAGWCTAGYEFRFGGPLEGSTQHDVRRLSRAGWRWDSTKNGPPRCLAHTTSSVCLCTDSQWCESKRAC